MFGSLGNTLYEAGMLHSGFMLLGAGDFFTLDPGDTLEGLSDDAFVQTGSVSLVDELNLGAEFGPLPIDALNHVQETQTQQKMNDYEHLNQYDSLKLQVSQSFSSPVENVLSPHSDFSCSPVHPQTQTNGLFPDDVADGSPMWGHQTSSSVSNQNGSPFHQGPTPSMQQNKSFVAHHSFALFQASEPHHPCASLQLPQSMNAGESTRNQPDGFMESRNNSPHFCGNQEGSYDGPSPAITSCSINTQFSPPFPYNSNQISPSSLLQSTATLSVSQQAHPLPDFPGSDAFATRRGTKQEDSDSLLNSSTSLTSNNFHVLHSAQPQGTFSSSKLSAVNMNFSTPPGSGPQLSHFSDPIEGNGFPSLDENLLRQVESQSASFTELDPEALLQEDLLPHFDETAFVQDAPKGGRMKS
ncbi:hypothetical protein E2320_001239 [Naja naja]|nr:hypothetical protein E2320_001239 [Naja naja]